MIAMEGSQASKQNQWSLCCSLIVLKTGGQEQSVCNYRFKHPGSSHQ